MMVRKTTPSHNDKVLGECSENVHTCLLADVLTGIFNTSLTTTVIPRCLKETTIIPMPKKSKVSSLNDIHLFHSHTS